MTVDEAMDHAQEVLQKNRLANAGTDIQNGALWGHAVTATILMDIANQLKQAQDIICQMEAHAHVAKA